MPRPSLLPAPYRIRRGEYVGINYAASAAPTFVRARARVRYDSGDVESFDVTVTSFTTDRTQISNYPGVNLTASPHAQAGRNFRDDGFIESAQVLVSGAVKRGQLYVRFVVADPDGDFESHTLCEGYVYPFQSLSLGQTTEPGPGGGEGFLSWVAAFAGNRAGNAAAVDFSLALANTFRKVHGLIWYYVADATAGTRTFQSPVITNLGGAKPTGFTTSGSNAFFWNMTADITLTVSEQGAFISMGVDGKDGRQVLVDTGAATVLSAATAPSPFPLLITEDELVVARFPTITSGVAGDLHSAFLLIEEWLVL